MVVGLTPPWDAGRLGNSADVTWPKPRSEVLQKGQILTCCPVLIRSDLQEDVAVNLNLGLLLGQQKRFAEAEIALRAALRADPQNAVTAYNLGVLMATKDPGRAIQLISQAARLRPDYPQYAYAVAYYLRQNGREAEAAEQLQRFIQKWPEQAVGYLSLGEILEKQGQAKQAAALYRRALKMPDLSRREQLILMNRLRESASKVNTK